MAITEASKGTKQSTEWATPKALFDLLNAEFHFTLDPCATIVNAKCERFYTKEDNGLSKSWTGERVYLNAPYGSELSDWIAKAVRETREGCPLVVALFPPRTCSRWFHEHVSQASELRLLQGRVRFENPDNPADRPQDPSCIAVFREGDTTRRLRFWDWKKNVYR